MTPELFRKIQEMQQDAGSAEAEGLKSSVSELAATAEARQRALEAVGEERTKKTERGEYDWTGTYQHWDKWEDVEETRERLAEEQEKLKNRRAPTSCNHDHSAERKLMDMTTREKLDACDDFRVQGNAFYREGQYARAADRYRRALVYFEYVFTDTDEEQQEVDALRLLCLLNHAASKLKIRDYAEVHSSCNEALKLDPNNAKAHFRRATAYRIQDDFDQARHHILKAREADPSSQAVRREYTRLREKMGAYKEAARHVGARMLQQKLPEPDMRMAWGESEDMSVKGFVTSAALLSGSTPRPKSFLGEAAGGEHKGSV